MASIKVWHFYVGVGSLPQKNCTLCYAVFYFSYIRHYFLQSEKFPRKIKIIPLKIEGNYR